MAYSGRLETGYTTRGTISPVGEADWFGTTYIEGLTYSVKVQGTHSGGGTLGDPSLYLLDAAGNRLLYNDDISPGVNRDAQLTFKIGATANYQLLVREMGDNATGSYTISNSFGYASNGNDRVTGASSPDGIVGMAGNDWIHGAGGNDRLFGAQGHDTVIGGSGNDAVYGGGGNDMVRGQGGNDLLVGDAGADILIGGLGADRFVFRAATDSGAYGVDRIVGGDGAIAFQGIGVQGGDVLDLSRIDANVNLGGNQAFRWDQELTYAAGTATLRNVNGETVFYGHVNNDRQADVIIRIADGGYDARQYDGGEFIL